MDFNWNYQTVFQHLLLISPCPKSLYVYPFSYAITTLKVISVLNILRLWWAVTNRSKGLDPIQCLKNCGWRFVTLYRRPWSKPYPKSNVETYITICKIDSQREFAVWLRKLKQGLCINLEGQDGEGGSKGRGYRYTYGWFMLRFDRKQQNSLKQLSFNKNKQIKTKTNKQAKNHPQEKEMQKDKMVV